MTRTHLLLPADFVSAGILYEDLYPAQQDDNTRVVVPVMLSGKFQVKAIVDTGAPWCIFDPGILSILGIGELDGVPAASPLSIRGVRYTGRLVRLMVTLDASLRLPLDVEATAFVPDLHPDDIWDIPNFIGLEGLLNRIRFAVDPQQNMLYFGH